MYFSISLFSYELYFICSLHLSEADTWIRRGGPIRRTYTNHGGITIAWKTHIRDNGMTVGGKTCENSIPYYPIARLILCLGMLKFCQYFLFIGIINICSNTAKIRYQHIPLIFIEYYYYYWLILFHLIL